MSKANDRAKARIRATLRKAMKREDDKQRSIGKKRKALIDRISKATTKLLDLLDAKKVLDKQTSDSIDRWMELDERLDKLS